MLRDARVRTLFMVSLLWLFPISTSARELADTTATLPGNWAQQLYHARFNINDPRIHYPRFLNFCRKVYNWGDKTFNSYDTTYVVSTGKNWKFIIDSTNDMQRYGYLFDIQSHNQRDLVSIRSNLAYDLGFRLSFMAVSVGYTWKINELMDHSHTPRSTFNFSFTCARFSAEIMQQDTKGNTYIDRFAQYNEGKRVHLILDNTRNRSLNLNAYYFFNHRKFSHAAAYCYSKYQKRSAGTWLLGARYIQQYLTIDLTNLPAEVLAYKPESLGLLNKYNFHDICLQGGYAYNLTLPHNWLLNFTLLPGLGYRRSLISRQTPAEMVATNVDARFAAVYNHRAFFATMQARFIGNFIFNTDYTFLNGSEFFSLKLGIRF